MGAAKKAGDNELRPTHLSWVGNFDIMTPINLYSLQWSVGRTVATEREDIVIEWEVAIEWKEK